MSETTVVPQNKEWIEFCKLHDIEGAILKTETDKWDMRFILTYEGISQASNSLDCPINATKEVLEEMTKAELENLIICLKRRLQSKVTK